MGRACLLTVRRRRLEREGKGGREWSCMRIGIGVGIRCGMFLSPSFVFEMCYFPVCPFLRRCHPAGWGKVWEFFLGTICSLRLRNRSGTAPPFPAGERIEYRYYRTGVDGVTVIREGGDERMLVVPEGCTRDIVVSDVWQE